MISFNSTEKENTKRESLISNAAGVEVRASSSIGKEVIGNQEMRATNPEKYNEYINFTLCGSQ